MTDTRSGDLVVTLLGCRPLLVLRPVAGPGLLTFKLVGRCYFHGLDDTTPLLGPLPKDYQIHITHQAGGYGAKYRYKDAITGEITLDDPRLEDLSDTQWEHTSFQSSSSDEPVVIQGFRNKETGKLIDYDPRLEPEILRTKYNVKLQNFRLC